MRKFLLTILFFLICSTAHALTQQYLCTSGGTWSGSVWVLVAGNQGTCTGGSTPITTDEQVLNASSGNVTVAASTSTAQLSMSGYAGTMTVNSAVTLTDTGAADLQGTFSAGNATTSIIVVEGGLTLDATPTNTGNSLTIKLTTAGQTLTSGGFNWPGALNFDFAGTYTLVGNWYTGGLTTLTLAPVLNHTTTETYTAAGGLTGNVAVTGNLTQLYIEGGTWTTGGAQPIEVPMTITPSVSNITLSGICTFGGSGNTLTYTASTGTVTTTGSTLEITPVTTSVTLATSGLTFDNVFFNNSAGTINLPTTFTINGIFSTWNVSYTFSGVTTINCVSFVMSTATTGSLTNTFPAGTTINVSTGISLTGSLQYQNTNAPLIIKSGTALSPIYIDYTGTSGNALVSDTSFTDVQFTGLSVYDYSQTSNQPTLTRTTGVNLISPNNIGGFISP